MESLNHNEEVLIVDDNPENLKLLNQILEEDDYRIRIAKSGSQAIKTFSKREPDIVLLDIMMPEMDGYETCMKLNELSGNQCPIIFISAINSATDKVKAFKLGAVDYIEKPFNVEEVKARVENHLTILRQQRQLENKNKELKKAKEVLKESERLALLGEISAKITHEINNPINYISVGAEALSQDIDELTNMCKMVMDELANSTDERLKQKLEKAIDFKNFELLKNEVIESANHIRLGSNRVAKIVRSLKGSFLGDENEKQETNLNEILSEAIDVVITLSNKKIKVSKNLSLSQTLHIESNKIFQVFLNLLSNAEEAVSDSDGKIKVSTDLVNNRVEIKIEDNGGGISEEMLPKLFDPYISSKGKGKSRGLGLSICYGIINEMGGSIEVKSKKGKTTFSIILPTDK